MNVLVSLNFHVRMRAGGKEMRTSEAKGRENFRDRAGYVDVAFPSTHSKEQTGSDIECQVNS
jgi:hypothetical protein